MAPIPIYTQSPINAAKPDGVTPKTASPPPPTRTTLQFTPTTTTALPAGPGAGPPPPQPGARPQPPGPTGTLQSGNPAASIAQTAAQPPRPTPTTRRQFIAQGGRNGGSPPPPQPGPTPVPPGAGLLSRPPQQQPGNDVNNNASGTSTSTAAPHPPPQMAMPSLASDPYGGYPVGRSTSTTQTPSGAWSRVAQPTLLPTGTPSVPRAGSEYHNLEHPPGYIQDAYAADMDTARRAAAGQLASSQDNSSGSYHHSGDRDYYDDYDEEGVWDSTKKLVQAAGERLSAAESAVWERINTED